MIVSRRVGTAVSATPGGGEYHHPRLTIVFTALHFKLAIANENSDENTDEAEFMYKPQLDERRDSQLIEMLPEYLVEEISFPRAHAAKFYSRVLKSLTERLD